jgi:hypothetical protein
MIAHNITVFDCHVLMNALQSCHLQTQFRCKHSRYLNTLLLFKLITPGLDSYTQVNLVITLRRCLISFFSLISTLSYIFLAGLRKVHPAYRMVNARWAGVFNRVPTLCNQLIPHLLADILQTLHSCYGHIEDVHVTFWKCSDITRKMSM